MIILHTIDDLRFGKLKLVDTKNYVGSLPIFKPEHLDKHFLVHEYFHQSVAKKEYRIFINVDYKRLKEELKR